MSVTDDAAAAPGTGALAHLAQEYEPMGSVALTDEERWPAASPAARTRLADLLAEPGAPRWTHRAGDRLTSSDLAALAQRSEPGRIVAGADHLDQDEPDWVRALIERAHAVVPRYRAAARSGRSNGSTPLAALPLVTRADLVADMAAHVPVDVPLNRVLEGSSSGSVGAAIHVPLHPVSIAADLLALHALVERAGVAWRAEADRLALALVVEQERAFTYGSLMQAFPGDAYMARVNLDPRAWTDRADREAWFARHDPQVVSTSTLPLLTLLDLAEQGLAMRPLAVINGATHLTPAARTLVRDRWGAPVIDVYGLREVGLIAWAGQTEADGGEHLVLPRRVHVEVLDDAGTPVPDGVRGEVVVTVEENPYLPLLRYRTGDTAALRRSPRGVALVGLEGRRPVSFRDAAGVRRESVDVTGVLQACGLLAWHLHQDASGDLTLLALPAPSVGRAGAEEARDAVGTWLSRTVRLTVARDAAEFGPGKTRRFSADGADRASV